MELPAEDFDLYPGDEIEIAAERSRVRLLRPARSGRWHGHRLLDDLRNADWREYLPRSRVVTGRERHSGSLMAIRFKGTLRLVNYVSDAVFGAGHWQSLSQDQAKKTTVDTTIADHPLCSAGPGILPELRTPPWIRQEFHLQPTWAETLAGLPKAQKSRIRRFLRRFDYRATCFTGQRALEDFYNRVLVPAATNRFGAAAILPSKESFLAQSGDSVRIDLLAGDIPVAANLVALDGKRLFIRKGALIGEYSELKGSMDTLDYFTLLMAQLLGCEVLDFGLCRPYLEDGALRYKAKWGTRLSAAGGLKSAVRIRHLQASDPVLMLLRRNRFIEQSGTAFITRVLWDDDASRTDLDDAVTLARSAGIDTLEIMHAKGNAPPDLSDGAALSIRYRELP